jgi:hypothetical protein
MAQKVAGVRQPWIERYTFNLRLDTCQVDSGLTARVAVF